MDNSGQANFVCPPILQPKDGLRYYLHFVFCSDCAGRKTPQEALAEATQSGRLLDEEQRLLQEVHLALEVSHLDGYIAAGEKYKQELDKVTQQTQTCVINFGVSVVKEFDELDDALKRLPSHEVVDAVRAAVLQTQNIVKDKFFDTGLFKAN